MFTKTDRKKIRQKKHLRIRKRISGTADCPRLAVYRSLNHMYAQLVDDTKGVTLVSASTLDGSVKADIDNSGNIDAAKKVGELLAKRALDNGIRSVVFDRGGNIYHGRIKAVADGAREAGLEF